MKTRYIKPLTEVTTVRILTHVCAGSVTGGTDDDAYNDEGYEEAKMNNNKGSWGNLWEE